MNLNHKTLTCIVFAAGLLTTAPAVWSESSCVSQDCDQLLTQVELLKNQVHTAHSDVKKLETALADVRQDVSALQGVNLKKPGLMTTSQQLQRTGRGNRNRSAYPD